MTRNGFPIKAFGNDRNDKGHPHPNYFGLGIVELEVNLHR